MRLEFSSETARGRGGAVVSVFFSTAETPLDGSLQSLDKRVGGAISRAISSNRFEGRPDQILHLTVAQANDTAEIVVVGVGPRMSVTEHAIERAAATAYLKIKAAHANILELSLQDFPGPSAAHAAMGIRLAAYKFDKYKTSDKIVEGGNLKVARILTKNPKLAKDQFRPLEAQIEGIVFARDLVSEPPNILFPAAFCETLSRLPDDLSVEILDQDEMSRQGMHALLAVGRGSVNASYLAVLRWNGCTDPNQPPVAIVGKGVCFDAGGISLKKAEGMEEMKWDMGGAAAVAGLMLTVARRRARANVVGILGLVENMPDGAAMRPGDVVSSMSGRTIEIIDTDAEGRLVLADALCYARERFRPTALIDVATLTSAMITALGHDYAGILSNNDDLAEQLLEASQLSSEPLWRLPLHEPYRKQIESAVADMKNVGGAPAGSITAALFLQNFVGDTPWAHLDIAPIAWRKSPTTPLIPEGATGYGVRLLDCWLRKYIEPATAG